MASGSGWAGRILLVDLESGETTDLPTADYSGSGLGGRSLGAALAWDLVRPGIGALDPANPLMFLSGPLGGTLAPSAGRVTVCGLSPQAYPRPWFSRSSMGGDLGCRLKGAGYDGLVVRGRAAGPVVLVISEDGAITVAADDLWGRGIMATQQALRRRYGALAQVAAIGPAGESLSCIASIGSNEGSAAGQGGFGAVMGSKNLKAVVALGDRPVRVARPEALRDLLRTLARELAEDRALRVRSGRDEARPAGRPAACGRGCLFPCATHYTGVRGRLFPERTWNGVAQCASYRFGGAPDGYWNLGFETGFELNMLANDWGINHWDVLKGLFVWLAMLRRDGLLTQINGREIAPEEPRFWYDVLVAIATRHGPLAEVVADGGWRAILRAGLLPDEARQLYTGWGYANHWDGRGPRGNTIPYPFWLVSALLWMTDTRDPMGGAHGYAQNMIVASPFGQGILSWEQLQALGERYFGASQAMEPASDTEGKAEAAVFSMRRAMLKDSLPVCDRVFPRLYSAAAADGMPVIQGIAGPDLEAELLRLVTGEDWTTARLEEAADRALALERVEQARDTGRTRADEQHVLDFFCTTDEEKPNPLTGRRRRAEPAALDALAQHFYALRGWDPVSGLPRPETLAALGLGAAVSLSVAGSRSTPAAGAS